MKEEDSEVLASQAKRIEAEDKGWSERFKAAYGFREKSADLEQRFRSDQEKLKKIIKISYFDTSCNMVNLKLIA